MMQNIPGYLENFITKIRTLGEQNGAIPQKQGFILVACLSFTTTFTSRKIEAYENSWSTATWLTIGWCLALY